MEALSWRFDRLPADAKAKIKEAWAAKNYAAIQKLYNDHKVSPEPLKIECCGLEALVLWTSYAINHKLLE